MKLLLSTLLGATLLLFTSCGQNNKPAADTTKHDSVEPANGPQNATIGEDFYLEDLVLYPSEAELIKHYGAANVKRDTIWGGEGTFVMGTKLYGGTEKEVEITWDDTLKFERMIGAQVSVATDANYKRHFTSPWKSKSGVELGMNAAQLETLNGKAFTFFGFGWDYSGSLSNWKGGKLDNKKVFVVLGEPEELLNTGTYPKEYERLLGDKELTSDNADVKKINPVVVQISVSPK